MCKKKNILFIITEDWYYLSHRRDLALFGKKKGFKVSVLTKINDLKSFQIDKEINIIDWKIDRASKNIFRELYSLKKLIETLKNIQPDIVHAVGLKPIIYTGVISKIFKNISFLYAFAGLGSMFINTDTKKYFFQKIIFVLIKFLFRVKKSAIVFQNNNDLTDFNKIIKSKIKQNIVMGSGIDPNKFKSFIAKDNEIIQVLLPARLLFDKGIEDFIYCAIEIKKKFNNGVKFVIAGKIDSANPSSITADFIEPHIKDGNIQWLNDVKDIRKVYDKTHIICFPSFREGNPKALLESACCNLSIIAYDVPGCNDIIVNNHSGILVPFRNQKMLKESIEKLILNKNLRNFLGHNARKHVIKNFSNTIIFDKYLNIWKNI
jgi:glycosyltransferase involved in cell wall biosynthesis